MAGHSMALLSQRGRLHSIAGLRISTAGLWRGGPEAS